MNNINRDYTISFFTNLYRSTIDKVTTQQQKILMIASVVITALSGVYTLYKLWCWKAAVLSYASKENDPPKGNNVTEPELDSADSRVSSAPQKHSENHIVSVLHDQEIVEGYFTIFGSSDDFEEKEENVEKTQDLTTNEDLFSESSISGNNSIADHLEDEILNLWDEILNLWECDEDPLNPTWKDVEGEKETEA